MNQPRSRLKVALAISGLVLRASVVLGAFAAVVYGTLRIYEPAAYIVGGGLVLLEAARARRREG